MARWLDQVLHIDRDTSVFIGDRHIWIGTPDGKQGPAILCPKDLADAQAMSLALRMAAKRLEEIGKQLANRPPSKVG